ncbi:ribonuclease HII [Leuconostocaceae bacterium ESL0958]|nr:ribonuclease HII [Leuconostocaceae bacterium ESL0958]
MTESIVQIKAALADIAADDPRLTRWRQDHRVGVQKLVASYDRKQAQLADAQAAFAERFAFERTLWAKGYQAIAGVDEVGRGPLAGPVVAAAVILPADFEGYGVIDSKQLSAEKRVAYAAVIREQALAYGLGVVDAAIIDAVNIYEASRLAMRQAVQALERPADYLLVDAMQVPVDLEQQSLIKGDARSNSIAAASILAKVYRDQLMTTLDQQYPGYDLAHNAGYGTKKHLAGLAQLGPSPIHRRSFKPVQAAFESKQEREEKRD